MIENSSQNRQLSDSGKFQAELIDHGYRFKPRDIISTTVGTFRVIDPLGVGGFSEVYYCQQINIESKVAIKVLINKNANLQHEAKTAANLKHDNIVRVLNFAHLTEDNTPIIISDYVEGETLQQKIKGAKFQRLVLNDETLKIVQQIGSALDYAHEEGIVHRDIKPGNIIIGSNQIAHLTDFGLADIEIEKESQSMRTADVRQQFAGTIPYMTPEQLLGRSSGSKLADIYALAVMVYEMFTGRLPYNGHSVNMMVEIIREETEPLPPSAANAELPRELDAVLIKALKHQPEDRYKSASNFVTALTKVASSFSQRNTTYQAALELVEQKEWRQAKSKLNSLPVAFKEAPVYREQVNYQVRLLDLFEKAQSQIKAKEFETALSTLEELHQLDPNYDIKDTREKAVDGRAAKEIRSLKQQYDEALDLFNNGAYQTALDMLDVINQKDPNYEDHKLIRTQAQKHVSHQNELRRLYNQGVEFSQKEDWIKALHAFEKLDKKEINYEDVGQRLAIVKHFAELADLYSQAIEQEDERNYAAAIHLLSQIKGKNSNYKPNELSDYSEKLVEKLHNRSQRRLASKKFSDSLISIAELKEYKPDYPGIVKLEESAKKGLADKQKLSELQKQYKQAEEKVESNKYNEALALWQKIETKIGDLPFGDERNLVRNIKEGLYSEATTAIVDYKPEAALRHWQQLYDFDPNFQDRNGVIEKANNQITRKERNQKLIMIVSGVGIFALLIFFGWIFSGSLFGGPGDSSDTPLTQTAVALLGADDPTKTPTEEGLKPTPTKTPTATKKPTIKSITTVVQKPITSTSTTAPMSTPITPTMEATKTSTAKPTATKTPITPTSTATTAAPTIDSSSARVKSPVTIFSGPDTVGYAEIQNLQPGTTVTVVGRSANSSWFFINTSDGVEGWVSSKEQFMTFTGEFSELPVIETIIFVATPNGSTATGEGLTFDFWHLTGNSSCDSEGWNQSLFMAGQGDSGSYTYFVNGQRVGSGDSQGMTFDYQGSGSGAAVVVGRVVASSGQEREITLLVSPPSCAD